MPSLQSLFSTNAGITDAELTTYSHTTASLADDDSSTHDFTIAKSALIKKVTSSVPSRLRLYSSDAARTADSRNGATTTNPPEGLLIDVEFTDTPDTVLFTPLEVIGNQESPLNSTIYAKIFNLSGGASTVAVSIEAYSLSHYNPTLSTLTDAANISWDLQLDKVAQVTLADNRTLDNPTNQTAGSNYFLIVKQDATGSRTLSFDTAYKWEGGTAPTLSTAANAIDIISFISDGTNMYGSFTGGFA